MKIIPTNYSVMVLLCVFFSVLFSCNKDSDLFADAVLSEPIIALENRYPDIPADEVGYVIRTFAFSPKSDAYLQDEQGLNQSIIRLQEDFRTSYLKFDLSEINGEITGAVLKFSIDSDEGDGKISIYKGDSNAWSEDNLSVDNAPKSLAEIASINNNYKVGAPIKIDLDFSSFSPEQTTLIMTHSEGNDLAFASKESTTNNGPKLIVSYKTLEDSQLIEIEEGQEQFDQPKNPIDPGAYYVTTNGKSTNDGRTEATSWNIEHAFDKAIAGDVVYVKAGNYGNLELIADNSGSINKLIKFIGYRNQPGDIESVNGSTFKYGDKLDSSIMPLLEGIPSNGIGSGTGITALESYIHIENFQITQFEFGLLARASHATFKNIIVAKVGDFNPNHTYPNATNNPLLNYFGNGIVLSGNNTELLNCFVQNSGAQGITFNNCTAVLAKNNTVYSDNTVNPTDYYFLVGENTINSEFINTKVFRKGALEHRGHGIVFKGNDQISDNTVDGFEITNTVLEVQFPNTTNNTFKNGAIKKEANVNSQSFEVGGINLANGSHHNLFEDILLTNCSIKFLDWKDGLRGDISDASDSNTFRRVTVNDAFSGIAFAYFQVENHSSSADNNLFEDCSFNNLKYLFEVDRANTNTVLKNCNFNEIVDLKIEVIPNSPSYPLNSSYQNCIWNNVGFTPPN